MDNETLKSETFTQLETQEILWLKTKVEGIIAKLGPLHDKMVVAGGCYASWLLDQAPNDIDIFYLDTDEVERLTIYHELVNRYGANAIKDKSSYRRDNPNVTHVWNIYNANGNTLQFIFTKYKTRVELIAHFDYVHCMVSYHRYNLYITRKTFDAIKSKHLIANNEPRVKDWRRDKFIGRGWTIPGSDDVMSVQAFNNLMRQPVSIGNWQSAARINPVRNSIPTTYTMYGPDPNPYMSHVDKFHIEKLIADLEKNGI